MVNVKTQLERQDELVEELLQILQPQLDGQPALSATQHRELQAAIANFVLELRGG